MDKYELAEILHNKQCPYNHIDQCGWWYENDDKLPQKKWNGWAHNKYLTKAEKLITEVKLPLEDIVKVIEAL